MNTTTTHTPALAIYCGCVYRLLCNHTPAVNAVGLGQSMVVNGVLRAIADELKPGEHNIQKRLRLKNEGIIVVFDKLDQRNIVRDGAGNIFQRQQLDAGREESSGLLPGLSQNRIYRTFFDFMADSAFTAGFLSPQDSIRMTQEALTT